MSTTILFYNFSNRALGNAIIILSNENGTDVETRARHLDAQYFFKAMTDISEMESIINQALA
jgi:hypothetical protein